MSFSNQFKLLLDELTNITPENAVLMFEEFMTVIIKNEKNKPAINYNCNYIVCEWDFPRVLLNSNNKTECLYLIRKNLIECGFIEMNCSPRAMNDIKQFVFSKELLTKLGTYVIKECNISDPNCSMLSITI